MATKAKGEPFSVRFSAATDRAIAAEAKRLNRSKSSIVEALAEEAMRIRRFPGIAFRGEDSRRRPWVIGTGLDVWEIVEMLQDYGSAEALLKGHGFIDERQARLAQAYYEAYPAEIDEAIAENRRPIEERLELYPWIVHVPPS
jgi:uncharacterized protein (DUF433 family)